ncbi:MAG: HNH endonuclease [Desulfuromonas sp.]
MGQKASHLACADNQNLHINSCSIPANRGAVVYGSFLGAGGQKIQHKFKRGDRSPCILALGCAIIDAMHIFTDISEEQLRKERESARKLRKSQWWQNRIAKGRCYYCNGEVAPKELTLDHLVPLVRGGRSAKGNCVPCCKECNSKKRDLLPTEWDTYLEQLQAQPPGGAPEKTSTETF